MKDLSPQTSSHKPPFPHKQQMRIYLCACMYVHTRSSARHDNSNKQKLPRVSNFHHLDSHPFKFSSNFHLLALVYHHIASHHITAFCRHAETYRKKDQTNQVGDVWLLGSRYGKIDGLESSVEGRGERGERGHKGKLESKIQYIRRYSYLFYDVFTLILSLSLHVILRHIFLTFLIFLIFSRPIPFHFITSRTAKTQPTYPSIKPIDWSIPFIPLFLFLSP